MPNGRNFESLNQEKSLKTSRVKGGRPKSLDHAKEKKAKALYFEGLADIRSICQELSISRATFYRYKTNWDSSILRVGIEDVFDLPYSSYAAKKNTQGHYINYDIEFCRLLSKTMHKRIQLVPTPFHSLIKNLDGNQFDISLGMLSNTEHRQKFAEFSSQYALFDSPNIGLIMKKGFPLPMPRTIGVQIGSFSEQIAENDFSDVKILKYRLTDLVLRDLKIGLLDGAIMPNIQYHKFMQKNSSEYELKPVRPMVKVQTAVATQKENFPLLEELEGALKKLRSEGELDSLHERFFYR